MAVRGFRKRRNQTESKNSENKRLKDMVRKHRNRDKIEDDSSSPSSSSSTEDNQKEKTKKSQPASGESFLQKSRERRILKRQIVEQKRLARLVRKATAKASKEKCSMEENEALKCTKPSSRVKKGSKPSPPVFLSPELKLPKGFDRSSNSNNNNNNNNNGKNNDIKEDTENETFYYLDAMFDSHATLQYLQNGRKGELYQKTMEEARREFRYFFIQSMKQTNFGGCITPVYLTPNEFKADFISFPPLWPTDESLPVWFVVGLSEDYDCSDLTKRDMALESLRKACDEETRVVGLYATLEYPNELWNSDLEEDVDEYEEENGDDENPSDDDEENFSPKHNHREIRSDQDSDVEDLNDAELENMMELQFSRAVCLCEVAQDRQLPLQLKIVFASHSLTDEETRDLVTFTNSILLSKLIHILENYPTLKVHLTSWNGSMEDTDMLCAKYPERIWWGVTGSCSFARNSFIAQQCVLKYPWNRRLLESASVIPTPIAKALGRSAFAHSGCIPWVASSVASLYPRSMRISAIAVARSATLATLELYTRITPSDGGRKPNQNNLDYDKMENHVNNNDVDENDNDKMEIHLNNNDFDENENDNINNNCHVLHSDPV
jgi:hypothetical protein